MKKNAIINIILFFLLVSCGKNYPKNEVINFISHENAGNDYVKKRLSEEKFDVCQYFSGNSEKYIKYNDRYIVLDTATKGFEYTAEIYEVNKDFEKNKIYNIKMGKGPNEGMDLDSIVKIKNKYYIYDRNLCRFLIYDKNFEYIETYYLYKEIGVSTFFKHNNKYYAIGSTEDKITIYEVNFEKKVHLKEKGVFEYSSRKDNFTNMRRESQIVKNGKGLLIIRSGNIVTYFSKDNSFKKIREIYLGVGSIKIGDKEVPSVSVESLLFDTNNNFITKYSKNVYKFYDYKNDDLEEIKTNKNVVLLFKAWDKIHYVLRKNDNYYLYKNKK
ncbi:MAG: hypothetical protein FXF47_08830 [Candidatus Mcinerneyibacterium aminivorans]|uniref:6-bladed beta-propeller n=1 Tax=Candidatus Mcinerneyibacterium aminivorans TaxID=2703815 RepID=A0A5D0M9Z8_9BACT|nr:MAG: hypothetical protein FXF47_08830 [Candidatus Mcinerneyibacterium aminivorans]